MRIVILLIGILFFTAISWAFGAGDFFVQGGLIFDLAWGKITLADLYLGFFLFSVLIFFIEKRPIIAAVITILLFLLGNGVAALYLFYRYPEITKKLRQK